MKLAYQNIPLYFIIIMLLSTGTGLSNPLSTVPKSEINGTIYETKLKEGIEAFYQTDWSTAVRIFDSLQSDHPDNPRAYFFEAMIPFWQYFFSDSSSVTAKKFFLLSQDAIDVSHKSLKSEPSDTTLVFLLSGLHGYRSLIAAKEKLYREAIESSLQGYRYTRQLLQIDSDDPNAMIGKGFLHFMLGSIPSGLKWLSYSVGFKADKEYGLQLLQNVAESSSVTSNDARMMLAHLYKKEGKVKKALAQMSILCKNYPENIIFNYFQGLLFDLDNNEKAAKLAYMKVASKESEYLNELIIKSRQRLQTLQSTK